MKKTVVILYNLFIFFYTMGKGGKSSALAPVRDMYQPEIAAGRRATNESYAHDYKQGQEFLIESTKYRNGSKKQKDAVVKAVEAFYQEAEYHEGAYQDSIQTKKTNEIFRERALTAQQNGNFYDRQLQSKSKGFLQHPPEVIRYFVTFYSERALQHLKKSKECEKNSEKKQKALANALADFRKASEYETDRNEKKQLQEQAKEIKTLYDTWWSENASIIAINELAKAQIDPRKEQKRISKQFKACNQLSSQSNLNLSSSLGKPTKKKNKKEMPQNLEQLVNEYKPLLDLAEDQEGLEQYYCEQGLTFDLDRARYNVKIGDEFQQVNSKLKKTKHKTTALYNAQEAYDRAVQCYQKALKNGSEVLEEAKEVQKKRSVYEQWVHENWGIPINSKQ